MRIEDIYFQIKSANDKYNYLPSQSLLPDDIYQAIRRAVIWICTENNALYDTHNITIQPDVLSYTLTKTFKSIIKLVHPNGIDELEYIKPENAYLYNNDPLSYTFKNNKIIFLANQNVYVGQTFTLHGYIIPTQDLTGKTEIPIEPIWDEVIYLKAMSLIVPVEHTAHQIFRAEAIELSRIVGGKSNYMRDKDYQSTMDW